MGLHASYLFYFALGTRLSVLASMDLVDPWAEPLVATIYGRPHYNGYRKQNYVHKRDREKSVAQTREHPDPTHLDYPSIGAHPPRNTKGENITTQASRLLQRDTANQEYYATRYCCYHLR